jgi:RNase adapter protein RapZ
VGIRLIIVSGLSGSGKSIALHTLEDLGFYCIDNLPMFLLSELARGLECALSPQMARTAVGIDARNQPERLGEVPGLVADLRERGVACHVLYLEARPESLIKRFSETRRKHPLTAENRSLAEAIKLEGILLAPILDIADLRIDTTHTNVHQLRDRVLGHFQDANPRQVSLLIQTFGFKQGVPRDVDFVIDVRCLPNPHWQPQLRPLTGRDTEVACFLEESPEVAEMVQDLSRFFERWVPRFEADGRSYLTIAIGCTGGQHRSVYVGERLRDHFAALGRKVMLRHRELS